MIIDLNNAVTLISSFSPKQTEALLVKRGVEKKALSISSYLQNLVTDSLPVELSHYITNVCPTNGLTVEAVGHSVELLKDSQLTLQPSMYAELTGELAKWQDNWLLIAHEGGDPIIVKTTEQGEFSPVYSAMQGMGFWDFAPIADSIGQFLVCICAIEHALNFPGLDQPLDDDFNLAPAAANWLFPFLRKHAGSYYDEWASVFENYQLG